jgi:hypothetical protein
MSDGNRKIRPAGRVADPPREAQVRQLIPSWRRLAAPLVLIAMLVFGVVCGVDAYGRAAAIADRLHAEGFTVWPGGADDPGAVYLWKPGPGPSFALVEINPASAALLILPIGFSVWMAGTGWLLRRTAAAYVVAAAGAVFTLLVTGGPGNASSPRRPLIVDARIGIVPDHGRAGPLCGVQSVGMQTHTGNRGSTYLVVAHRVGGADVELYRFSREAAAAALVEDIRALPRIPASPCATEAPPSE